MEGILDLYSPPEAAYAGRFLGRFRRPVHAPVAESYIVALTAPGDLVLDPFCQDAAVLRAAESTGRRALGVARNPLVALLVRVEAAPPGREELSRAVARIEHSPKVDITLGEHLDGLYTTACSRCGEPAAAEAFLWERTSGLPLLRDYACPRCGHTAREPTPQDELARHLAADAPGLYRRLVAERLRGEGVSARLIERLLGLYTPRNLYALTALILKIELLFPEGPLLDALRVALLGTMDEASKLYQAGEPGWQPVRSLEPPRQYREVNVWRAFCRAATAIGTWPRGRPIAQELTEAPDQVGLVTEPLPRVAARLKGEVRLALSQLPRFDPTFAALSYLWSSWLLGREGSRAAAHLLAQRTPEKARYLRALRSALAALEPALAPGGRLALVFQAPATRHLESLLLAGAMVGLPLLHEWHGAVDDRPAGRFAVRRAEHHLVYGRPQPAPKPLGDPLERAGRAAVRAAASVLSARGEPAAFTNLHGAIWCTLAREGLLGACPTPEEAEALRGRLEAAVQRGLEAAIGSELVLQGSGGEPEEVVWWLAQPPQDTMPLADRVEAAIRELLRPDEPKEETDLLRELARRFPGAMAPSWPLVRACLESYGEARGAGRWTLAAAEAPGQVQAWRRQTVARLWELGVQLGYEPQVPPEERQLALDEVLGGAQEGPGPDLAWLEDGRPVYEFWLRETATLTGLPGSSPSGAQAVLVIPERRVALWRYRLQVAPEAREELTRRGLSLMREGALAALREAPDRARLPGALGLADRKNQLQLFS